MPKLVQAGGGRSLLVAGRQKHLRPAHLHPKDLLDHLVRDHGSDPAQREQAMAMINGVMPGGLAGPFASAQARSKALALPAGARPPGAQGASPSATSRSGSRLCSGVLDGEHGSGFARQWDRVVNRCGSWKAPSDVPINGWTAGVVVWWGARVFTPAANTRRGRSPSIW